MYIPLLLFGAIIVGFLLGFVVQKLTVAAHYLSKKKLKITSYQKFNTRASCNS